MQHPLGESLWVAVACSPPAPLLCPGPSSPAESPLWLGHQHVCPRPAQCPPWSRDLPLTPWRPLHICRQGLAGPLHHSHQVGQGHRGTGGQQASAPRERFSAWTPAPGRQSRAPGGPGYPIAVCPTKGGAQATRVPAVPSTLRALRGPSVLALTWGDLLGPDRRQTAQSRHPGRGCSRQGLAAPPALRRGETHRTCWPLSHLSLPQKRRLRTVQASGLG